MKYLTQRLTSCYNVSMFDEDDYDFGLWYQSELDKQLNPLEYE